MLESECSRSSCSVINCVHKQFVCAFNIKQISWTDLFKHLTELSYEDCILHQDLLLNLTVGFPIVKTHPLKVSYQLAFLKVLLNKAEESDVAHPAIYDFYVSLLSQDSKDSGVHYRHFCVGNKYITVQESSSIVSLGTTGLCTWQGAVFLADWSINNSHLFQGKKILELGCGVGLTGLALCLSEAAPETYVFSDCHPEVLKKLRTNIELNAHKSKKSTIEKTEIKILPLDWEQIEVTNLEPSCTPDIILAADVVYDSSLFNPLCKTLKYFLCNEKVTAILACTVRNHDTLEEFIKLLVSEYFLIEKEADYSPQIFCCPTDTVVHLYRVKYGSSGDREGLSTC